MIEEFQDDGGHELAPVRLIAGLLGVDFGQVASAIGIGWQEIAIGEASGDGSWFYSGRPPQVLIRVEGQTAFVAGPRVQWQGVSHALPTTTAPVAVPLVDSADLQRLADIVDAQARAERRRFSYCPYCRAFRAADFGAFADNQFGGCTCSYRVEGIVY